MMAAFTRQELITAARAAEQSGDHERVKRLGQMIQNLPPESPVYDPNTVLGKPARFMSDLTNVGMDAMTRGMASKIQGEQAQADTRASRERLSGAVELPADIAGAVMGAPYKIGGMVGGGVAGGLEGVASAYGHQPNWIPGRDDLMNMGYEGVKGAALGSGMAKIGQKLGEWWSGKGAKATAKYPTDKDLAEAATKSAFEDVASAKSQDLLARTQRLDAARKAQGEGQGAFEKLQPANPAEAAAIKKIAERGTGFGSKVQDAASATTRWTGKKLTEGMGAGGLNFATHGYSGTIGTALEGFGELIRRSPGVDPKQAEALASIIREGGDLRDSHIVNMARDMFAKTMLAAERSPVTPNPRPNNLLFGGPR
jgi:hypothetical protein